MSLLLHQLMHVVFVLIFVGLIIAELYLLLIKKRKPRSSTKLCMVTILGIIFFSYQIYKTNEENKAKRQETLQTQQTQKLRQETK